MGYIEVEKDLRKGVAVVWMDQPGEKVNKLVMGMEAEFEGAFEEILQDPAMVGVVLISRKKDTFLAGADIEEFLKLKTFQEAEDLIRKVQALMNKIADFPKPIVAAIHGAALGGGLEVALACHYRIATDHPKTILGLPEVKLGILPAAGGTQRLPRFVGLQKALEILLTGKNIYPKKAKKIGLVQDVVHPYGLLEAAKIAAFDLAKKGREAPKPKLKLLQKILEAFGLGRKIIYKGARKMLDKQTGGHYPSPFKIIDCVQTGLESGFKAGLEAEAKNFASLALTSVSRELIQIFFNMNGRKKNPYGNPKTVNKLGILGGGFMGAGVAQVSSEAQINVLVRDLSSETFEQAEKTIWKNLDKKVKKKALTSFQRDQILSRIFFQTDTKGLETTDLIVEAVFEDLELKQKVLAEIEALVPKTCVFGTNTSCIPISEIASKSQHPERVLGMHYFSPVPKMPLLEIIVTPQTADWALATAYQLGLRQKKTIIVVNDGPGFYTTRILAPYMAEAIALLEEGAKIEHIDGAMKQFGFPVGPITLLDEVGIDVGAHVARIMAHHFEARGAKPSTSMEKVFEAGYKGRKNNRGFYQYGKKKKVNQEIYSFFGEPRKDFSFDEIQDRMSMIMINESAHCLGDGILNSPEDGDLGAIFGLGFPPFRGGPFRYMDFVGVREILKKLENLQTKFGPKFLPAPLLGEMAEKGEKFYGKKDRE